MDFVSMEFSEIGGQAQLKKKQACDHLIFPSCHMFAHYALFSALRIHKLDSSVLFVLSSFYPLFTTLFLFIFLSLHIVPGLVFLLSS